MKKQLQKQVKYQKHLLSGYIHEIDFIIEKSKKRVRRDRHVFSILSFWYFFDFFWVFIYIWLYDVILSKKKRLHHQDVFVVKNKSISSPTPRSKKARIKIIWYPDREFSSNTNVKKILTSCLASSFRAFMWAATILPSE